MVNMTMAEQLAHYESLHEMGMDKIESLQSELSSVKARLVESEKQTEREIGHWLKSEKDAAVAEKKVRELEEELDLCPACSKGNKERDEAIAQVWELRDAMSGAMDLCSCGIVKPICTGCLGMNEALSRPAPEALKRLRVSFLEDAAKEALKTRLVFLTNLDVISEGVGDDTHTMKVRKQMRKEIADAFMNLAAEAKGGEDAD